MLKIVICLVVGLSGFFNPLKAALRVKKTDDCGLKITRFEMMFGVGRSEVDLHTPSEAPRGFLFDKEEAYEKAMAVGRFGMCAKSGCQQVFHYECTRRKRRNLTKSPCCKSGDYYVSLTRNDCAVLGGNFAKGCALCREVL